jgi:uncharacterized cofD-like protein
MPVEVTAVINMADNGGSSGRLRQEYGVLPPGDVRQAVAALSTADPTIIADFEYRYTAAENAELAGHPRGNLELASLATTYGFDVAVRRVSERLDVRGRVLPVTLDMHDLCAEVDGRNVLGEYVIAETALARPRLWLAPQPTASPDVVAAIERADVVVIAPGDLYGSLAPTLLVGGVSKALASRRGQTVCVTNLVNKPDQTAGFTAADYVSEIERFADTDCVDVLVQNTGKIDQDWLVYHARPGEEAVAPVEAIAGKEVKGIDMVDRDICVNLGASVIAKSFVRHDGQKVAAAIGGLLGV